MTDGPFIYGVPEGRVLETGGGEDAVGNICSLPRATPQRIEAARRNVREIPDEHLDRSVFPWRDRESGEAFELVRGYFNPVDPEASNATAFVVSDGWLVGLRPAGFEEEAKSGLVGNMGGGRA